MGTSLTLAYLGYQSSDVRLFDSDAPIPVEVPGATTIEAADDELEGGGLQEIEGASGGLIEVQDAVEDVPAGDTPTP